MVEVQDHWHLFVISKKLVAIAEQTQDVLDTCACATMQQYGLKIHIGNQRLILLIEQPLDMMFELL